MVFPAAAAFAQELDRVCLSAWHAWADRWTPVIRVFQESQACLYVKYVHMFV